MPIIEIDGHTYSGEGLAARLEVFTIALGARRAKATGRDPGLAQVKLLDLSGIVEDPCPDSFLQVDLVTRSQRATGSTPANETVTRPRAVRN